MQRQKPTDGEISGFRAFNRIYTEKLGFLNAQLDKSAYSLTEARILYEITNRSGPTAADISRALSIDPAQLSRTLSGFTRNGLIESRVSDVHAKHRRLRLTDAGQRAFTELDKATQKAVGGLLGDLSKIQRRRLLDATKQVIDVFDTTRSAIPAVVLRSPIPGDLGWVTSRQAILYFEEYGWDWTYEALVAEILSAFAQSFDPAREQAWIAEVDGAVAGSVFLMQSPDPCTAKLRLLYVEPVARGLGIGRDLVHTCIERAREFGYETLELWTNDVLVSARRIYEAVGFQLVDEAAHNSFGKDLVGQTWRLNLNSSG